MTMKVPVYLDYAATTPVDARVAEVMSRHLTLDGVFGNAGSRSHGFGWSAEKAVEEARGQVAALVNASPKELVWTSGATESNNLAIKGAAHHYRKKGRHIVTSKTEHKAVLDPCRWLGREGYDVTYLNTRADGLIDPDELEAALRPDTILVSILHVNNEIGVIQDIESIGRLTRERGIVLHVDAAQSAGKVPIDLAALEVDLMSFSAHKIYGPKGVGALYIRNRPRVRLEAQVHGGGQERGLRAGTLATHQVVGMGEAFRIAGEVMAAEEDRIHRLRDRLWNGLKGLGHVYVNGHLQRRVAGNLNVSFAFVTGEALLLAVLDEVALSSGSACASADAESSHVLRALGLSPALAASAIRFSVGRFTTAEEIDHVIGVVSAAVTRLRYLSPLWELYQEGVELSGLEWALR